MGSGNQLHRLAARTRDSDRLRCVIAVVKARRMSRRQVRRAKNRQDGYLFLKALAVTVQTICMLLVCFLGILAFYEIRSDTESSFYATELTVEIILLLCVFAVIAFENLGPRLILIFLSAAAFIANVIHIIYFMLFDRHSTSCRRIELLFGTSACVTNHLPLEHHSTFASIFLAVFHFSLALLAIAIAASHDGTISEIVDSTHPMLLARRRRRHRRSRRASSSRRRHASRKQSMRKKSPKRIRVPCTGLDITKLPDGTKFKTADNKSFNMEYYVENGMFFGTGTETTNKTAPMSSPDNALIRMTATRFMVSTTETIHTSDACS